MLKRLTISRFKSIYELKDLEFGRVNLFIGGNGSGKSNLLEALGMLSASLKEISEVELQRRGVRLSLPVLFKSAFNNTSLEEYFTLTSVFENDVEYQTLVQVGDDSDSLRIFSESLRFENKLYMKRSASGITVEGLNLSLIHISQGIVR